MAQGGAPNPGQQAMMTQAPQSQQVAEMANTGPDPEQMMQEAVGMLAQQAGPQAAGQMLMQMGQQLMQSAPSGQQQPVAGQAPPGRR